MFWRISRRGLMYLFRLAGLCGNSGGTAARLGMFVGVPVCCAASLTSLLSLACVPAYVRALVIRFVNSALFARAAFARVTL